LSSGSVILAAYFFLLAAFRFAWARSEAATDFMALLVLELRRSLDAIDASFLLVAMTLTSKK